MRVLILTPDIDTRSGIARYTAALASVLADLIGGVNVHVQPLLGDIGTRRDWPSFRVFNPIARRLTAAGKFRFAGKALRLGFNKYDLVICTHLGLSPVAGLARLLWGTPFWITLHGSEAWSRFPMDVRWAVRQAGLLLPVSRYTADAAAKANGLAQSKMCVLYNAIPDDFAALLAPANSRHPSMPERKRKCILSVGRVTREFAYKGYDTVIKALPEVLRNIPDTRYVIVGEGNDSVRLKSLAREVGVQDHVEIAGGISDAELAAYYKACDVFALPSRAAQLKRNSWEGEGFGRVYVEAALAEKPVLGSTGGGAAEAVLHEQTGLLVNPESTSEVAGGLVRLLRDPLLAARMGAKGRQWAIENFTSRALRKRLARLLAESGLLLSCEAQESTALVYASAKLQDLPHASEGISRP